MYNLQHLISIIIPTYNRAHLIGETLESVISQTYKNWECLIIDDGSEDYTDELMEFYSQIDSRIRYYKRPMDRRKGANACRNYGFELCEGEFVNWFDSDDLMHPEKLEIQFKDLKNSSLNFSVCQAMVFAENPSNMLGLRHKNIISDFPFGDYLMLNVVWMTPSALWRRKFLKSMNYLFDENLLAAQEWEFHCRVLFINKNYSVVEEPLVLIRKHYESLTYNELHEVRIWNYFKARVKIYRNSTIQLDFRSSEYLKNYLLSNFKDFIRNQLFHYSFISLFIYIFPDKKLSFKSKLYAIASLISYTITRRGHLFLRRINYSL